LVINSGQIPRSSIMEIDAAQKIAIEELQNFISDDLNKKEWKRAEAVRLRLLGFTYQEISRVLNVSSSFIAKNQKKFNERGTNGLRLQYKGSVGYLSATKKQETIEWLRADKQRKLPDLENYLKNRYGLEFKSKESYYQLLRESMSDVVKLIEN
jgi:transposase